MQITFEQFMQAARENLEDFEREYLANHEKTPDLYPLEIDQNNEGVWWEQLAEHSN
jgi:hypothetical protein